MDFSKSMSVAASGMRAQTERMKIISENIANANSAITADGDSYRPAQLISGPAISFRDALANGKQTDPLRGVAVYSIEPQNLPPRRTYEPGNPQADEQGYVTYPGFDHAAEMALMVKTARSYEANVVALNAARQMYANALQIGKRA